MLEENKRMCLFHSLQRISHIYCCLSNTPSTLWNTWVLQCYCNSMTF